MPHTWLCFGLSVCSGSMKHITSCASKDWIASVELCNSQLYQHTHKKLWKKSPDYGFYGITQCHTLWDMRYEEIAWLVNTSWSLLFISLWPEISNNRWESGSPIDWSTTTRPQSSTGICTQTHLQNHCHPHWVITAINAWSELASGSGHSIRTRAVMDESTFLIENP